MGNDNFEGMNSALKQQCVEINKLLVRADQQSAWRYFEVGNRVAKIMAQEAKYGRGAISRLATATGKTQGWLYDTAKVASSFDQEQFGELLAMRNCHDNCLTFSHVVVLAGAGKRGGVLLSKTLENGLSVREMRREADLLLRPKKATKAVVTQVCKQARKFELALNEWLAQGRLPNDQAMLLGELYKARQTIDAALAKMGAPGDSSGLWFPSPEGEAA